MKRIIVFWLSLLTISLMGQDVFQFHNYLQKKDIPGAVHFVQKLKDVNSIEQNSVNLLEIVLTYEQNIKKDERPAYKEVFDALIERGINVNHQMKTTISTLDQAAFLGIPYYVKRLLENGADPNIMNKYGLTTFLHLVFFRAPEFSDADYEIVDLLLKNGVDINQQIGISGKPGNYEIEVDPQLKGNTALMIAVYYKNKKLIRFLMERGADPSIKNVSGQNAFDYAEQTNDPEIISLLKK